MFEFFLAVVTLFFAGLLLDKYWDKQEALHHDYFIKYKDLHVYGPVKQIIIDRMFHKLFRSSPYSDAYRLRLNSSEGDDKLRLWFEMEDGMVYRVTLAPQIVNGRYYTVLKAEPTHTPVGRRYTRVVVPNRGKPKAS